MIRDYEHLLRPSIITLTINQLVHKKKHHARKVETNVEKRLMKKTIKTKLLEKRTSVIFNASVAGVTVSKRFECFKSMEDFAFVFFSHGFHANDHVAFSILVEKVDGSITTIYNFANQNYIKCFVNAQGGILPKCQNMYFLAVHFCNDVNGNPDLMISCFNRHE